MEVLLECKGAGMSDYNNSGEYSITGIRFFMSGGNVFHYMEGNIVRSKIICHT